MPARRRPSAREFCVLAVLIEVDPLTSESRISFFRPEAGRDLRSYRVSVDVMILPAVVGSEDEITGKYRFSSNRSIRWGVDVHDITDVSKSTVSVSPVSLFKTSFGAVGPPSQHRRRSPTGPRFDPAMPSAANISILIFRERSSSQVQRVVVGHARPHDGWRDTEFGRKLGQLLSAAVDHAHANTDWWSRAIPRPVTQDSPCPR